METIQLVEKNVEQVKETTSEPIEVNRISQNSNNLVMIDPYLFPYPDRSNNIREDLKKLVKTCKPSNPEDIEVYVKSQREEILGMSKQRTEEVLGSYKSSLETILRSCDKPIDVNENNRININGKIGIHVNIDEINKWGGNLQKYPVNSDAEMDILRKKSGDIEFTRTVDVKFLRPLTPQPPGIIEIKEENDIPEKPAPPVIVRFKGLSAKPLPDETYCELPPIPPPSIPKKVIVIKGKRLPPPPIRVIYEKLPDLPPAPGNVIAERWLSYKKQKRQIKFIPADIKYKYAPVKNLWIEWEQPKVTVKQKLNIHGIKVENPVDYELKHGGSLRSHTEFPDYIKNIRPPAGCEYASESIPSNFYELEGDVFALGLINLEEHGLSMYKEWFLNYMRSILCKNDGLLELFMKIDNSGDGFITKEEAGMIVLRLNSLYGRSYGEDDLLKFFQRTDWNRDELISFREFKNKLEYY